MIGKHIKDNFIDGYLSIPKSGKGPGVIVIQEWWGLVPHIESIADRLADEGYVAFAPDLYHGQKTSSPDEAGKLMMSLRINSANQELGTAISWLKNLDSTNGYEKVGTIGFCMGGLLSLYAACKNSDVGACVTFYGGFPGVEPDINNLNCPFLGLYAEKDTFVTVDAVHKLEEKLKQADKNYKIQIYPNTNHAFFNDVRPEVYSEEAAMDAWQKVLTFYKEHLNLERKMHVI